MRSQKGSVYTDSSFEFENSLISVRTRRLARQLQDRRDDARAGETHRRITWM